ncbi:ABC transporter ATP-binding protein [Novosphingobium mangrovi (ex Huang et al. 2023)]|uniref:ABC transporter ATP-binding protein n=1 Tax=Novosphingobium mangrovi (ex Huang et al. 2023) TaxID=2976432 RepID=A0ABT2I0R3_9SPHN|nr:ABC transporter ATP-binding protein [Novosphingobium mangrovi (ex Huang et al. 2023)]MCT2398393.1 ABC transporter ATP-binding protein [Novosphingobium mangrovi (ex Huang et al. 2023)]
MTQGAIIVQDLGKYYPSRNAGRPTTLKGYLLSGRGARRAQHEAEHWGLRHVSFTVPRGRSVGVVGLNGAGKSTLLRLIGGVGRPDEGSITVAGRIGALLDIGAGLTEDLSGRENVFLLGVIAGMLRSEIAEQFDAIVGFAELEEYIEAPVRTYSTGMRMRLAFAVAIHTRPEVLLIDEALAVGDKAFQHKCFARVSEIREAGCTIFLVSHDVEQIDALCDDVLFLKGGQMIAYGPRQETLALYAATLESKLSSESRELLPQVEADPRLEHEVNRFGSGKMQIGAVELRDHAGEPVEALRTGGPLRVTFEYKGSPQVEEAIAVMGIYAEDGTCCYETNSLLGNIVVPVPDGTLTLSIDRLDLTAAQYRVTVGLFSADWEEVYDYHAEVYPLRIIGSRSAKGLLNPPVQWEAEARLKEPLLTRETS